MKNPYANLESLDDCGIFTLPAFAVDQDCNSYIQRLSQVCGAIILPSGAAKPSDWTTLSGWSGIIDNSSTDNTKARYLVGIGSFLPESEVITNLSGGRIIKVQDRSYRFNFKVLNMDPGHKKFGRQVEKGWVEYDIWLETIGGRLMGGPDGMRPIFANAQFPYGEAANSRELMLLLMDFFFPNLHGGD